MWNNISRLCAINLITICLTLVPCEAPLFHLLLVQQVQALPKTSGRSDELYQQGILQFEQGLGYEARVTFEHYLEISRENANREHEAIALNELARLAYSSEDSIHSLTQSQDSYQKALDIFTEIGEPIGQSQSLIGLALLQEAQQGYDPTRKYDLSRELLFQAVSILENALDSANRSNNVQEEIAVLKVLAEAYDYYYQGDDQKVVETLDRVLFLARELGDKWEEAQALYKIAEDRSLKGEYEIGVNYYKQSLEVFRELNEREWELAVLRGISSNYLNLQLYDEDIATLQQGLMIAREIDNRPWQIDALTSIAKRYSDDLGQYQKALEVLEQALVIAGEIGERYRQGHTLATIGTLSSLLGNDSRALEAFQQALSILQELQIDSFTGIYTKQTISAVVRAIIATSGDTQQALELAQQALTEAREEGDQYEQYRLLSQIRDIIATSGDTQQALELAQQALTEAREKGDQDETNRGRQHELLSEVGRLYLSLGNEQGALEAYEAASQIYPISASSLLQLADYYHAFGKEAAAINYYHQSISDLEAQLNDPQTIRSPYQKGELLNTLGYALLRVGKFAEANNRLLAAAEIWESLRSELSDENKVSLIDTQTDTYRYLQEASVAQGKVEEALEFAERGRSRAFVEQLALRLDSQNTEALVSKNLPSFERLKQTAREQNATIVEYSVILDEQLYIWVVKPTGEVTFQQTNLQTLNTSLRDLVSFSRHDIGVRGSQFIAVRPREDNKQDTSYQNQRLRQLHQLLIEPIADDLPTDPNAPVIFVPQGELFLVPFPALQDANGAYLIDQHTILTAPSIQVLEKTRQERSQVQQANLQQALVVGNPTMPSTLPAIGEPRQTLAALPGAEAEARAVASLLHTKPLTANQAKKAAIVQQMPNARFIHLATHGLFDDVSGLNSAIALAPDGTGEAGDGLLTAAELAQMKLNAELVVLSACDTGQGRITGDGVIGLSRSLITAGVPSVLVSLWAVPDAPTAQLMTEFYRQFQQTGNKAQALRQAMLATKASHPNPRDWAAFTLIGEAE